MSREHIARHDDVCLPDEGLWGRTVAIVDIIYLPGLASISTPDHEAAARAGAHRACAAPRRCATGPCDRRSAHGAIERE